MGYIASEGNNRQEMKKYLGILGLLAGQMVHAQNKPSFSLYFPKDQYLLSTQQMNSLDSLYGAWQKAGASQQVSIAGYCDPDGSDQYNMALSIRRAKTVQAFLIQKGLSEAKLSDNNTKGYGEAKPVNSNQDETAKQQNRRVDIFLSPLSGSVKTIKQQIEDTAIHPGSHITLNNINFEPGMHKFLPSADPILIQLLDAMRKNPFLEIEVQGHICCIDGNGDGVDLQTGESDLSANRARAIVNFLAANGIDPERISARGFGHSKPIYPFPEKNDEERVANRRVEIFIKNK